MTLIRPSDRVTIHCAVKRGDIEQVKQMVTDGASVNEVDSLSFTPLHWAANVGAIEILQFLLWRNADPLCVTKQGWTAMHIAALRGFEHCIQSLADRGVCLSTQDMHGQSPGHLAAIHGNSSCLMTLLRRGADVETVDCNGWTMLHAASFHGRLGCVQVLLRWGLRLEDVDKAGNTAAHLAALEGHLPVLQCLVSQVKTPLYLLDTPNDHGETAETLAQRFMKEDILIYIGQVKDGQQCRIDGVDVFEQTAFPAHSAAYSGDLPHLQRLIEGGVIKIDERDEQGCTPLHKAAGQGHIKIIQWLCENGADPNIVNHLGERPADIARRYGELAALDLLDPQTKSLKEDADPHDERDETLKWLNEALPSNVPLGYAEGELETELVYDREAALGRAQKKIEKLEQLLKLAKSDYKQLGGGPTEQEIREREQLQAVDRELDECRIQLEYERLRREKLEARLDIAQRQVATLSARLTSTQTSPRTSETNSVRPSFTCFIHTTFPGILRNA
ncbi:Ankyrin repeat domain-containing protein 42 [Fasciola hepatica]|uniref:Ankyrin repeat domain-containing protein 42 n=1 Tax=Fasciola hepatica TaxID=6192 RepID=A0A4E0R129_FASHE|nr:Ankyrin repeat domain-containing protein 42 [Fasciola hepatica]